MDRPNNPQAFPSEGIVIGKSEDGQTRNFPSLDRGMTLRDYFAGQALTGHMSTSYHLFSNHKNAYVVAELCYSYADAMLKARLNEEKE